MGDVGENGMDSERLYVIADGARARFVRRTDAGAFATVREFASTAMHAHGRDLGAERPGRTRESATSARHAVEPRRNLKDAAEEDFARLVAAEAAAAIADGGHLVVVAPARAARRIEEALPPIARSRLTADLHKDLTRTPDADLAGHLLGHLRPLAADRH